MKILVICQYYYPEPFRINTICEELVRRGHEILVVTGEPNYPEGKIYEGYENHQRTDEVINGVRVHRCPIIPRKSGVVFRVLNYYSYVFKAKQFVVSNKCTTANGSKFDVVFVYQLSPVMMAEPAIAYKRKYNIPVILYCLDLWPESLIAGGINRDSIPYKYFYRVSKKIYTKMDCILVTSRLFKNYLKNEFNIDERTIDYLPQYAEKLFEEIPSCKTTSTTNFVFAGNIGKAQNIEVILRAAKLIADQGITDQGKTIYFHIVGDGQALDDLQNSARINNINNVIFYGRKPLSEMPKFYSLADAMIVSLLPDPLISMTLPAKIQSYMAAGKPIIASADGEIARVINESGCGFCAKADDEKELISKIKLFLGMANRNNLGIIAKEYYKENFSADFFMGKLENILYKSFN